MTFFWHKIMRWIKCQFDGHIWVAGYETEHTREWIPLHCSRCGLVPRNTNRY